MTANLMTLLELRTAIAKAIDSGADRAAQASAVLGIVLPQLQATVNARQACWCETCRPITFSDMRMVICPTCGNKRCPHATFHGNACTGSNAPGQPGSSYEHCANTLAQAAAPDSGEAALAAEYTRGRNDGWEAHEEKMRLSTLWEQREAVAWLEAEPGVSLEQAVGEHGMLIHSMLFHIGRREPAKRQAANGLFPLYTCSNAKAGEVNIPAELRTLSDAATPGMWRSMRDGNQYLETAYLPAAKYVGASRIDGPKRPWNPHTAIAFGIRAEAQETVRFTDADADFVCGLVNWCRETIALSTQRGDASEMGVANG